MSSLWAEIFGLSVPPLEMVLRGSAMYLFLFLLFRVVIRRRVGNVGMADLLVLVVISEAAQNGMSGTYHTVPDGIILVSTIVAWNVLLDWLAFRFPRIERCLQPPPLLLVRKGRLLRRNLRAELISEDELMTKLREHGVSDLREVEKAYLESDGEFSVFPRKR